MTDNNPHPRKALGQHWLQDDVSLQAMCHAADVQAGDTVLEVGPGMGDLTRVLLDAGASVVAVELDERLIAHLDSQFRDKKLELHQASILAFDLTTLPTDYKLVANIPYYLTSKLLRVLSESTNPPVQAALLIQKEVAERVTAEPGSMSLLSITAQFYWRVSRGTEVPARLFTPPPKVDSQILVLERRNQPPFQVDERAFFRLVKAGFSARRKKIISSLAGGLRCDKSHIRHMLQVAGVDPDVRAQTLSLAQWYNIYQAVLAAEDMEL